eukprot:jgi/Mesvir1/10075/Mv21651-RA.1
MTLLLVALLVQADNPALDLPATCRVRIVRIFPRVTVKPREQAHPGYGPRSNFSCHIPEADAARLDVSVVRLHSFQPLLSCEGNPDDSLMLQFLQSRGAPPGGTLQGKPQLNLTTPARPPTPPGSRARRCVRVTANNPAVPLSSVGAWGACAMVFSSDVLSHSSCGPEIDRYNTVIRINGAPVAGYERDVGARTDIAFHNWQMESWIVQQLAKGQRFVSKGEKDADPGLIILSDENKGAESRNRNCRVLRDTLGVPTTGMDKMQLLSSDAMMWEMVSVLPEGFSLPRLLEPTQGFRAVLASAQYCASISIYGLGGGKGHYYQAPPITWDAHRLNYESALLYNWESRGVMEVEIYDNAPPPCVGRRIPPLT